MDRTGNFSTSERYAPIQSVNCDAYFLKSLWDDILRSFIEQHLIVVKVEGTVNIENKILTLANDLILLIRTYI